MIADDTVIRRRAEPLTAELDNEIVMLDADKSSYFTLGSVGSRVWELLEEPISVSGLFRRLVAEFEIDPGACRREVQAFIGQLLDAQLVVEPAR